MPSLPVGKIAWYIEGFQECAEQNRRHQGLKTFKIVQ
jgi:hypothetical protein